MGGLAEHRKGWHRAVTQYVIGVEFFYHDTGEVYAREILSKDRMYSTYAGLFKLFFSEREARAEVSDLVLSDHASRVRYVVLEFDRFDNSNPKGWNQWLAKFLP